MADQQVQTGAIDGMEEVAVDQPESQVASIGRRAGRGLRWALGGNLIIKFGSFALSLAMVRLLAPHDFGLYAVALAANAFLIHVNDMGMIAATVQWRGEIEKMAATATTMAIAFSLAWYGLFWVGAPILANAAGSPDAAPLVRLLTFTIVLDGITAVSVGVIQRRFQQDKLMKAIGVGFVFSAVTSLTLAVAGAGAYSFVVGALVQSVVVAVLVLRTARLPFRLGFDRADRPAAARVRDPARCGPRDRVRRPLLGLGDRRARARDRHPGVLPAGLQHLQLGAGMVGAAVRYVSIPAFSRLAEGETETFSIGVQRALPLMVAFVAPVAAVMVTLSPALIHVLYGAHWVPAAEALRFLAFVMVARMLTALVFDIQTGLGNTKVTILAEPRLAGRPAPSAVDRRDTPTASAAPPSGTPSSPSSWPSRWQGGCCTGPASTCARSSRRIGPSRPRRGGRGSDDGRARARGSTRPSCS